MLAHKHPISRFLYVFLVVLIVLGPAAAREPDRLDGEQRAAVDGNQPPGNDVEGGPLTTGEYFRQVTEILPAEIEAADPEYRRLVELIRTGQADKRIMRHYWFLRWRLEPFDRRITSDRNAAGSALLEDRSRKSEAFTDSAASIPSSGNWVDIGPYTVAGRTTGLDRPAGSPDTLYASTANGGIWRTTDAGATWEPLSDFEETLSGGSVLLDPTDPDTIYFGTGEGSIAVDNYPGIGVLKSTDGGVTWTASNNFSSGVRRLAIHPSEPGRVYAAGNSGCFVSTDAGATFDLIDAPGLPTGNRASDVIVRPDNADWVYCAIWDGTSGGIYRSTDRGANWSLLDNGLPSGLGRIALAISQSDPATLIAGVEYASGQVYKTTDGGNSWSRPKDGGSLAYCGDQCWYDNAVGIDPADPDILYAGGISAYKSTDGGTNWSNMSSGVHVDQHFVFTPAGGEVFLANDGGIYRSTNHGGSWTEWSQGMDTTQFYGICRDGGDDYWAFGGTQDNGSIRRRLTDGWREVLGADGGQCIAGPAGSGIVLGEMQNHQVRRSTNGGGTWYWAEDGIGDSETRPWVGVLAVDPTDRNNMWTATSDVYRSLDAKASAWVKVGDDLRCGSAGCVSPTDIEVAPGNSDVVYVGYRASSPVPPFYPGLRGGVIRTSNALDGTVTWTDVTSESFPFRSVISLAVHPDDPDTVYALFSGIGDDKLWKSTDGGATWVNRTGDLPDIQANDIVIDADGTGSLIVATDLGVYRSDDDGSTWYGFSDGLPRSAAIMLTLNRSTGTLRVGTHGRSIFEWQPSSAGSPVAVPDGDTVAGSQMTVAKLGETEMRVTWDAATCTGADYNLFHGDLDDVAALVYTGAECNLGTTGQADLTIPDSPSGNVFFLIASDNGAGTEGPHGHDSAGQTRPADGIGMCGITAQDSLAACP